MSKKVIKYFISQILLSIFSLCVFFLNYPFYAIASPNLSNSNYFITEESLSEDFFQKDLNLESILALNWFQTSAEYKANAYQAYTFARLILENLLKFEIKNPIIIMDLDETVLDNSPYYANLIFTNEKDTIQLWNKWVLKEQAKAIPGAIEFIKYVRENTNAKIFYISNRFERFPCTNPTSELEIATINNLKNLGISDISDENVILKCEFSQDNNLSKTLRRNAIANGKVDGINHTIILSIGDNLQDFSEDVAPTIKARNQFIIEQIARKNLSFSQSNLLQNLPVFIILPNPFYGSWEKVLYKPEEFNKKSWRKLTSKQLNIQRLNALEVIKK